MMYNIFSLGPGSQFRGELPEPYFGAAATARKAFAETLKVPKNEYHHSREDENNGCERVK